MKLPVKPGLLVLCLIVAGAIFAVDVLIEPHVAAVVAYVGLVLMCWGSTWPFFAYWLAGLATALVAAAYLTSPADFSGLDLADHGLALLVIWLTALLCSRQIRIANELERARAELQQEGDQAATTAIQAKRALRSERYDRERIEEELEETEHRYRAVFNQTFQLLAVLHPSGAVEKANETLRGIGSLQARSIAGTPIWDLNLWDGEGRERLRSAVASAASGDFFRDEFRLRRSSGDGMVVDLSLKPIRNPSGQVDLIILEARDITQHKRDQALIIQAQKMEVLGQFASGIAHDFNNLLAVIAGNLELVEQRVKDDAAVSRRIAKAISAVFQGRALTDRILGFARKRQLEPQAVDVTTLIAQAIDLSRTGLDDNTIVETDLAPGLWPCWADPVQLQTALLNLLINARDAMPKGGRITVRGSNCALQTGARKDRPNLPDGEYVVLSVADEGEGIPAEVLDKVTEPFFTTKGRGRGSGLGLSTVAGFTKQSGGDLAIDSTEGRGTTVSLYLPRSSEPRARRARRPEAAVSRADGRVLVVEDEPQVRDAAVSMLSDLGYRVEEASNSEEALALLRRGARFDLLLTDIMMPGDKDGRDLGRLSRAILPDLKILYSSANPEKMAEIRAARGLHEALIPKPYRYAELAEVAERLLADANGSG